jgi:hypothetical protein
MELQSSQWHVRLYLWSRETWLHFWGRYFYEYQEKRTNLCLYIRTLLVWMPLVVVLHLAVAAWLIFTFIYLPVVTFGLLPLGVAVAKTAGVIVVLAGVVFIVVFGLAALSEFFESKPISAEERRQRAAEKAAKPPGMIAVVGSYVVAKKRQICPTIQLVEKTNA